MKRRYQGSCHCGQIRFEVDADLDHVRACDCSICRRRGALIHRIPEHDFHLLTPLENLAAYQWGSFTARDYFCPVCGILPFRRPGALTPVEIKAGLKPFSGWAINVRCLEGVDLDGLPLKRIHGSELDWSATG